MAGRLLIVPVAVLALLVSACSEPGSSDADSVEAPELGACRLLAPGDVVSSADSAACDESVSAWLGYPLHYEFAYTWFHEAEWKTGLRRSICWAWTPT